MSVLENARRIAQAATGGRESPSDEQFVEVARHRLSATAGQLDSSQQIARLALRMAQMHASRDMGLGWANRQWGLEFFSEELSALINVPVPMFRMAAIGYDTLRSSTR